MSKAIGIDLGTGRSSVAYVENGKPTVIHNAEGSTTTDSVVCLKGGERVVGAKAKRTMVVNPDSTVSFIKRFMGVDLNATGNEGDRDAHKSIDKLPYTIVNQGGKPRVKIMVDDKERFYSPEEISSYIVAQMKKTAEEHLGEEVKDAVITCPAWFNDAQRQATKLAGELAGLNVLRIINEPTAAILAADYKADGKERTVAVFDIGCGTLDISVCELSGDDTLVVEVLASNGSIYLGGADFDLALVDYFIEEFNKQNAAVLDGYDIRKDTQAYSRLLEAAEKAKCELSGSTQTEVNLPYLTALGGQPVHFTLTVNRAKYDALTKHIVDKAMQITSKAFEMADKKPSEIDEILLVGGMTRSINIQEALKNTFGVTLNKSINPDEAVSLGAAIQANILTGGETENDILLLDVTPLSLGIETMGGVMTKLIEANTTIPTKKTQIFSTAADNQTAVTIHVLQGERPMSNQNKSIGMFNLEGIAPAKKGVPQIEVTFDIDANGILSVSAKDLGTNKEQKITIQNQSLSQDEIDRIKAEAEQFKAEDEKQRALVEKCNMAESVAYSIQSSMEEENFKAKIDDELKGKLDAKIAELLEATKAKDEEKVDVLQKELNDLFNPIASQVYQEEAAKNPQQGPSDMPDGFEEMFKQAQQNGGGFQAGPQTASDEPTVENAEFEEVK